MEEIVEVSALTKTYRGAAKPAVDGLDFVVREREIYGLLGPNGAGKSTTLMMLCGLLRRDGGRIRVFGMDVDGHGGEIRKRMGVAPQDIALFPALTAYENLAYFGRMYGMPGREIRETVHRSLEAFGLADKARMPVSQFSGGMKRRLNLVAALMHAPDLLILDEPTTGVDVQSRNLILDRLETLKAGGVTILYSSHLLEEAERVCTRLAVIDEGRLVAEGQLADILARHEGCANLEEVFLKLTGRGIRD